MDNNKNNIHSSPFSIMEENVLEFWDRAKIFEKSVERPALQGDYVFYDGPPFATGTPHYGHLVASIMKDVVPRYFTMNGYRVERKWGWDCHGLPIENIVEKEMNTKSKKEIEEIGISKFNDSCRSKVLTYADDWEKTIRRLGRWVDMQDSYRTMDLNYMESVWWVFKELWDKGLIYKDYRSMHICPRCETTLSQSEVTEGYQDIKDLSLIAKFKLKDEENTYILAWTTTPWTLIGNMALAVGGDIDYVKVEKDGTNYIVAAERINDVGLGAKELGDDEVLPASNIITKYKGQDLVGKSYEPLFDYYSNDTSLGNHDNGWKVYSADFVNTEEGTGIVHIAPAFGEDDMRLGKENNMPFAQHVGMDGYFKEEVKDFQGLNVKPIDDHMSTDVKIVKYLAGKDLLFSKVKYEHSYPHCWRCETPLINYATSSWFVNVVKIKDRLLESAKNINWSPNHIKEGRFGNWLEGARDWSISRQRFWASAMPIWECECGERKVIGSVAELEELGGEKVADIHKDKIDHITFACPECQGRMKRIPDVLDCWFESGSMPYAQMHYPFENKDKFEKNFPAQFIAEGADQTRAWFYYLHVIAGGVKETQAFNNVIVNGIVLAEDGKKMSKRLSNYPDPSLVMEKYGADALRMNLLSSPVMQAENLNFSEKGVEESLRKNIMLINNVYKFYAMYAEEGVEEMESDDIIDQWIIAKFQLLLKTVTEAMAAYNLPKSVRPITDFIDELSTWYLRRSRDRFKNEGDDKKKALATTKYIFLELSKVIAPFAPFMAENLWQEIGGDNYGDDNKSVHLEAWPKFRELKPEELVVLEKMGEVRKIVEIGLAKRDEAKIRIRQMLNKITVRATELDLAADYINLITDELNIRTVEVIKEKLDNIEVELDVEITPELKQEGLKRELIRFINMLRKDAKLSIGDTAKVELMGTNTELNEVLTKFNEDIRCDTLSSSIETVENIGEGFISKEVKIDDSLITILLKK